MSVCVLDDDLDTVPSTDLSDVLDRYLAPDDLPAPEWLTQLQLETPRRGLTCLTPHERTMKRLVDVLGAAAILCVAWPLMLFAIVAIKLTSPGPVIFKQVRVGVNARTKKRDRRVRREPPPEGVDRRQTGNDRREQAAYGKPFILYKFRTMHIDAERNGAQFAQKNDPRVTWLGRFMRKTRIDELPQLFNVLRGEMSLVGPRPERPEFIKKLSDDVPNYINRLGLKPGLTGLAQVINGYDNEIESFRRKVNLDLLYLQNCCAWNDLKILFRTVFVVLTGKGAL